MRRTCALIMMLTLPMTARGQDPSGNGVSGPDVAAALRGAGYPADMTADHSGEPTIKSSTGKILFSVRLHQCDQQLRCNSMEFTAESRREVATLAAINAWNRQASFGRAFQDRNGAAWVAMDVDTTRGMTEPMLQANIQRWITTLVGFPTFIAH